MIPSELRAFKQWCCSTASSKIPLNARTGEAASVDKPETWSSYADAAAAMAMNKAAFVGFVLSEDDPYTIIDLDEPETDEQRQRHSKILEVFDSYAELSKSRKGVHIIVKGRIPKGVRRDRVEVYSTLRYMICTGSVIVDRPIADRQDLLDRLYKEMDSTVETELTEEDAILDDQDILDMAVRAANGDKFEMLCRGEWQHEYPSQSEADFALLSIFAYYTRSNQQVYRLFHMSALGKREKAHRRDYLPRCLRRIRAQQAPMVDLSQFEMVTVPSPPTRNPKNDTTGKPIDVPAPPGVPEPPNLLVPAPPSAPEPPECKLPVDIISSLPYPDGLVGEIAHYIYSSSIRPVHEVGIASALGLTAGVIGRAYNISGTGLNQYIILIARTGSGKEGMSGGIDRLISAIRTRVPVADQFTGPGVFASGQALLKVLGQKPCFVSVLGEIGLTLQQICDSRANAANVMLRRVLLDLYGKSGWGDMLKPMVYSDKEKNTEIVHAPAVTIVGETTPETFFDGLNQSHIAEGLIPRFSIIEYVGPRPPRNTTCAFMPPDPGLIDKFGDLLVVALSAQQNNTCHHVKVSPPAAKLLSDFDAYADRSMNDSSKEVELQLWNRAHLKALKMSALLAIGHNLHEPEVTQGNADWAIKFVCNDIKTISDRFNNDEVGTGDARRDSEVRKAVVNYVDIPQKRRENSYRVSTKISRFGEIVPFGYLRRILYRKAPFQEHRLGANAALKHTLVAMVEAGILVQLPPKQVFDKYGVSMALYSKGPSW